MGQKRTLGFITKFSEAKIQWFIAFPMRSVILRYPTILAMVDLTEQKQTLMEVYMGQNWIPQKNWLVHTKHRLNSMWFYT